MVIGVCGCGYAGTAAVVDYLSEIDSLRLNRGSVKDPSNIWFEFNIAYYYDGLNDLEHQLCNHVVGWQSSDIAIRRFSNGMEEFAFHNCRSMKAVEQFLALTKEYLNSLIQVRWMGRGSSMYSSHMPLPEPCICQENVKKPWNRTLFEKIYADEFGKKGSLAYYYYRARRKLARTIYRPAGMPMNYEFYSSVTPDDFLGKTRKFVADAIDVMVPGEGDKIVLKQPFVFNDPGAAMRYFMDPKAIIVWRDPRDIFAIWKYVVKRREFVPVDNVVDYVKYMDIFLHNAKEAKYEPGQVLNFQYEDLIYNYDEATRAIDEFIGVEHTKHERRRFKPEVSCKNTRLFEAYPEGKKEFDYIAEHLKEFLYPFEKYPGIP